MSASYIQQLSGLRSGCWMVQQWQSKQVKAWLHIHIQQRSLLTWMRMDSGKQTHTPGQSFLCVCLFSSPPACVFPVSAQLDWARSSDRCCCCCGRYTMSGPFNNARSRPLSPSVSLTLSHTHTENKSCAVWAVQRGHSLTGMMTYAHYILAWQWPCCTKKCCMRVIWVII